MENIQVIIFDLDGTLYEDTHHFDFYAQRIKEYLPDEKQSVFEQDYEAAVNGKHTLAIGMVYDAQEDLILRQNKGYVIEAYSWDGSSLSESDVVSKYGEKIVFDRERMFNVGDLWWIPNAIGRHYGLGREETYEAFLKTREYMMTPEFVMKENKEFVSTLEKLSQTKKLVLLTNSPQPDSEVIVSKLGLSDVFDHKIFNGKKPVHTLQHFKAIQEKYSIDYTNILSVGDNYINEILPARELGCPTILIDSHQIGEDDHADYIVSNIAEATKILQTLI
ncbi:HAD family hydrolase [Bacillus salinus]|uniref:HAD family hydrolase n=1 Tax=Bacillus sp. HMF5848 TaxID=2495421 RepID=UPI00163AC4DE|nr:HAD family hydrolase [Bacillus sp. HMF5848]